MQPLTLYHYWRSSCSWRVRWAMALKQVPYESVPVNILKGENRTPEFLAKNPSGFVPTIVTGGRSYGESMAILEWLDEQWPTPPLLPKDPLARLSVRQLTLAIIAGTQPLQNMTVLKYLSPADEAARKPHAQHFIGNGLKIFETLLQHGKPGKFCYGDGVTMADLALIPQVYNALRFDVDVKQWPLLNGVYERAIKTPECDRAAPHNQPGAQ